MTKEEKVLYASSLLQEAGVDFKIGKVSYENTTSENPALNNAAKQFNDALLDEQAKKIKMLSNQKEELMKIVASRNTEIEQLSKKANKYDVLRKQFAHLTKVLHRKNQMIEELRVDGSKHLRDKIDTFNENQELEKKIKIYADHYLDACAELRQLKKKLANIVVNNVNTQALKSAESALVYKDKVIKEKDEVIDDIAKELRACKVKEEELIASIKEYQKEIEGLKKNRCKKKSIPTKDNPEGIKIDEAVRRIREALKNGHTVVVDYDDAADIINTQL